MHSNFQHKSCHHLKCLLLYNTTMYYIFLMVPLKYSWTKKKIIIFVYCDQIVRYLYVQTLFYIIFIFFPRIVDSQLYYCLPCEPLGGSTAICKPLAFFKGLGQKCLIEKCFWRIRQRSRFLFIFSVYSKLIHCFQ